MNLFVVLGECMQAIPQEPLLWLPILVMVFLLFPSLNFWLGDKKRVNRIFRHLDKPQLCELLKSAHLRIFLLEMLLILICSLFIIHVLRGTGVICWLGTERPASPAPSESTYQLGYDDDVCLFDYWTKIALCLGSVWMRLLTWLFGYVLIYSAVDW